MDQGTIENFDLNDTDGIASKWKKWCKRLERLISIKSVTQEKKKIDYLLFCAGESIEDIYEEMAEDGDTFEDIVDKIHEHLCPKTNKQMNIYKFRSIKQMEDEPFEEFAQRVKSAAKICDFKDVDEEVKSQVIQACLSERVMRKGLSNNEIGLDKLIEFGKMDENIDRQVKQFKETRKQEEKNGEMVNKVGPETGQTRQKQQYQPHKNSSFGNRSDRPVGRCRRCGGAYPHTSGNPCRAMGKECRACGKIGHFSRVCLRKGVNMVENKEETANKDNFCESQDNNLENIWSIQTVNRAQNNIGIPKMLLNVCGTDVCFGIDTGAAVNVIDSKTYEQIKQAPKLNQSKRILYGYGSKMPLEIKGEFRTVVEHRGNKHELEFIIQSEQDEKHKWVEMFPCLFTNKIGCLKGQEIELHIDPNVKPVQQKLRPTPFHMRESFDKELQKMIEQDIIEPVTGPTPWVSPVVIVPKPNNKIRICVDARAANKAIIHERHSAPTVEDLIVELNGARYISKFDLISGYHQLKLSKKSRFITAFSTHKGIYQYKRLNFGISSSSEIFQKKVEEVLSGLTGVKNISDDVIVFGSTKEEHDRNLLRVLERLSESGSLFIPNLFTVTEPLRQLTRQKYLVTEAMGYFNKEWRTEVTVDASPVGVALVMAQYDPKNPENRKIIMYAIVWACEKLHLYVYGCEFDIVTDNKAVQLIFGKPTSKPKARIERWCLRLLPYRFKITHKAGAFNISDYLSRNPINSEDFSDLCSIAENYINHISSSNISRMVSRDTVKVETDKDKLLVEDQLTVTQDGILMFENRVVIPKSLTKLMVQIGHVGHQGVVKTKQLMRYHMVKDMDKLIEDFVRRCRACQVNSEKKQMEPFRMSPFPDGPWENLSIDFFGLFYDKIYRLVLIDEYSRATPHSTTKVASSQLLFRTRTTTAQFPVVKESLSRVDKDINKLAAKNDKDAKTKMKDYDDKRFRTKTSSFKIGDAVIVKQTRNDKSYSVYDPNPYRIIKINGSMITASRENHEITRNSSFFKLFRANKLKIGLSDVSLGFDDKGFSDQEGSGNEVVEELVDKNRFSILTEFNDEDQDGECTCDFSERNE
ncbi:unnamed protein product [Brachionus calyciflorus]|uniref:CCHC-type domain-containing protein n=1 Tax=Brachionus calyciflorus TaxID=104777 RepID=A0A814HX30_9BILA|nr:unnamed protein product [Brachionus calyciflorus]